MRRVLLDIIIAIFLMSLYATELYNLLPPPIQLVSLKILLVSMGFIHAHIARKLAFPKVDWEGKLNAKAILAIAIYVIFIYAYSQGG